MGRAPAPQRHRHHHRPVISFKEQLLVNPELSAVSSALTATSELALHTALNLSKLLTAYSSPVTPKFPVARLPLRPPPYKDRRAGAAGTCRVPKLPGMSNNQALQRRQPLRHSFSAGDESAPFPECPSPTADRSNWFCQGTSVAPDPWKATHSVAARWLPTPASDKPERIHPSDW